MGRVLTSLRVEEHERLVEGERVVVRGRAGPVVAGDGLDDEGDEPGQHGGGDDGADGPKKELAANDEAPQVHVLVLLRPLVPGRGEEPALLRLIQLPRRGRQRRPVRVQVPAPIVIGGGVGVRDLQWPAPWITAVHTHPSPALPSSHLKMTTFLLPRLPFSPL